MLANFRLQLYYTAHLLREAAVPPPGGRARAAEPQLYLGVETHQQLVYVVVDSW